MAPSAPRHTAESLATTLMCIQRLGTNLQLDGRQRQALAAFLVESNLDLGSFLHGAANMGRLLAGQQETARDDTEETHANYGKTTVVLSGYRQLKNEEHYKEAFKRLRASIEGDDNVLVNKIIDLASCLLQVENSDMKAKVASNLPKITSNRLEDHHTSHSQIKLCELYDLLNNTATDTTRGLKTFLGNLPAGIGNRRIFLEKGELLDNLDAITARAELIARLPITDTEKTEERVTVQQVIEAARRGVAILASSGPKAPQASVIIADDMGAYQAGPEQANIVFSERRSSNTDPEASQPVLGPQLRPYRPTGRPIKRTTADKRASELDLIREATATPDHSAANTGRKRHPRVRVRQRLREDQHQLRRGQPADAAAEPGRTPSSRGVLAPDAVVAAQADYERSEADTVMIPVPENTGVADAAHVDKFELDGDDVTGPMPLPKAPDYGDDDPDRRLTADEGRYAVYLIKTSQIDIQMSQAEHQVAMAEWLAKNPAPARAPIKSKLKQPTPTERAINYLNIQRGSFEWIRKGIKRLSVRRSNRAAKRELLAKLQKIVKLIDNPGKAGYEEGLFTMVREIPDDLDALELSDIWGKDKREKAKGLILDLAKGLRGSLNSNTNQT